MPVDAIRVGHRHRKDMGDLAELVTNAKDSAVVCSIALQYGVPVSVIRKALLRDARGAASSPLGTALDILTADDGDGR
jgi:hypothetical protein